MFDFYFSYIEKKFEMSFKNCKLVLIVLVAAISLILYLSKRK